MPYNQIVKSVMKRACTFPTALSDKSEVSEVDG